AGRVVVTEVAGRRGVPAGDLHGECHAHRLVPGDRAPPLERVADHSGVERDGLARLDAARVGAALEVEVVDVGLVGVGEGDLQAVAGGYHHGVGDEPHPDRRDLDRRGVAGGGDGDGLTAAAA